MDFLKKAESKFGEKWKSRFVPGNRNPSADCDQGLDLKAIAAKRKISNQLTLIAFT